MVREPIERLKEKIFKENLWFFIFRLLKRRDMYAYGLRKKIKDNFDFWTGRVTSYKVLYLLERDGYVKSYKKWKRRYYKLTEKGLKQLKKAESLLKSISRRV